MFSDRNRAKTIPFGVVCAHTCISLYKGGPAPLRAKKLLVIARLLNLPPPPQKKNNNNNNNNNINNNSSKSTVGDNYLLLRSMTYIKRG